MLVVPDPPDAVSENLIDLWIHVAAAHDDRRSDGFTFVRRSSGLMNVEVVLSGPDSYADTEWQSELWHAPEMT